MTDETIETPSTPALSAGRITLDDVRTALAGTDPNATNASRVRGQLGNRGSFETIQKHLGTLRQELALAAAPPVAAGDVPPPPSEAISHIWLAAWTAAQVSTMARSERLAAERDAALLRLGAMGQDVAGLVATVDEQAAQIELATSATEAANAAHQVHLSQASITKAADQAARDQLVKELEQARGEVDKLQLAALHATEIASASKVAMREELARLTTEIGELKSHLYQRAAAAPAAD